MSYITQDSKCAYRTAPIAYDRGPIDFDHLSQFTLGNMALMRRLLGLFLLEVGDDLQRLAQAETAAEWCGIAHSVNNSACAIGAWRVAGAAEAAEEMNCDPQAPGCRRRLLALENRVGEANAAIEAVLKSK